MTNKQFAGSLSCALFSATVLLAGCDSGPTASNSPVLPATAPLTGGQRADLGAIMASMYRAEQAPQDADTSKHNPKASQEAADPNESQMASAILARCAFTGELDPQEDSTTQGKSQFMLSGADCPVTMNAQVSATADGQSTRQETLQAVDPAYRAMNDIYQYTASSQGTTTTVSSGGKSETNFSMSGTLVGVSQHFGTVNLTLKITMQHKPIAGHAGDFSMSGWSGAIVQVSGYTANLRADYAQKCVAAHPHYSYSVNSQPVSAKDFAAMSGNLLMPDGDHADDMNNEDNDRVCDDK